MPSLRDMAIRCAILIRDEDVHTFRDAMGEQRMRERIEVAMALASTEETERLRDLLRRTAALAHSLADDESGIDENETYKAALAAAQ